MPMSDGRARHGRLLAGRHGLIAFLLATASGCGSSSAPTGAPTTSTVVASTVATSTTAVPTATTVASATTTTVSAIIPPTTQSVGISVLAGEYVGSTGGSGNAVVRADGSGRFDAPDLTACPSCSNASAPRATVDFRLTSVVPTAGGGYRATGVITAESNPANEIARRAGPVGTAVEALASPAGGLTLSFLPANDVLKRQ